MHLGLTPFSCLVVGPIKVSYCTGMNRIRKSRSCAWHTGSTLTSPVAAMSSGRKARHGIATVCKRSSTTHRCTPTCGTSSRFHPAPPHLARNACLTPPGHCSQELRSERDTLLRRVHGLEVELEVRAASRIPCETM